MYASSKSVGSACARVSTRSANSPPTRDRVRANSDSGRARDDGTADMLVVLEAAGVDRLRDAGLAIDRAAGPDQQVGPHAGDAAAVRVTAQHQDAPIGVRGCDLGQHV